MYHSCPTPHVHRYHTSFSSRPHSTPLPLYCSCIILLTANTNLEPHANVPSELTRWSDGLKVIFQTILQELLDLNHNNWYEAQCVASVIRPPPQPSKQWLHNQSFIYFQPGCRCCRLRWPFFLSFHFTLARKDLEHQLLSSIMNHQHHLLFNHKHIYVSSKCSRVFMASRRQRGSKPDMNWCIIKHVFIMVSRLKLWNCWKTNSKQVFGFGSLSEHSRILRSSSSTSAPLLSVNIHQSRCDRQCDLDKVLRTHRDTGETLHTCLIHVVACISNLSPGSLKPFETQRD